MYCKCGNKGPIIEHKTGNTIQIVSQEVSASVHRAWRRK